MASKLPAPYVIADHKGVELMNSIGARYGTEMDWLQNGDELLHWMQAVALLTVDEAKSVRKALDQAALDDAARQLRDLREQLRAAVPDLGADFVGAINAALAAAPGQHEIRLDETGQPALVFVQPLDTVNSLVARAAIELADLVCLQQPDRLRKCGNPQCGYWFRDTSRNNRRRWCSMAVCGNRTKVQAHRARK